MAYYTFCFAFVLAIRPKIYLSVLCTPGNIWKVVPCVVPEGCTSSCDLTFHSRPILSLAHRHSHKASVSSLSKTLSVYYLHSGCEIIS